MGKCIALVALVMLGVAGCHGPSLVPLLAVGPVRVGDASVFDDAVRAARDQGHAPFRTDPEHGSFLVRANTDPTRETTFLVQCSQDGYITIVPQGGGVVRTGDAFTLTRDMREEYAELAMALERAIPEER